jgi:hypothetical protein
MSTDVDLWPSVIDVSSQTAPIAVLKQQASHLGEKTKNLVVGEVESRQLFDRLFDQDGFMLRHEFMVVATALGRYRRLLFWITQNPIEFYPLRLNSDIEPAFSDGIRIDGEEQLLAVLRQIFNHPKTIGIIQTLLAQSA